jgi:DNA-binding CsgD family transcriptional regulator/tetratricopeptide (TPR) repeat protein
MPGLTYPAYPAADGARPLERTEQLMVLRLALRAVVRGAPGRVVLVPGEAGIGKTALLREFRGEVGGSVRVLWAACDPLFTPRPLGPLLDLAETTGGALSSSTGEGAKPADVAAALLRELRSDGPAIAVLEDVHWADEATLDVLRLVGRRMELVPALLVISYRDDELDRGHPLRVVLGDLARGARVTRVAMAGLSRDAVARLAEPQGFDGRELHERTAGNPFFVTEVLAAATEAIPHTVRDAVLARVARLTPAARDALDAIAVVPGRVEPWLLERLVASAESLDECLGSGVLIAGRDGWVAFRHEIARLVVEESMSAGRRMALHRAVLAAAGGEGDLTRLAHHAEAAGDADAVLRFAPAAAAHASAAGARREAAGLYARALRFADRLAPRQRAELLERFAAVAYFTGMGEEATAALNEALAIHRASGDLLRQGDTLRQLAVQLGFDRRISESRAAEHEAVALLEQVPPGSELARTYAALSANYALTDDAEAIRWGLKAIALAEEIGCAEALASALNNVGTVEMRHGNPEGLAKLERSRELAKEAGDEVGVGRAYLHLTLFLMSRREYPLADRYLEPGIAYCHERGLETWQAWLTALKAESALARGHWDDAVATIAAMLRTLPDRFIYSRCMALVVQARVQARRGIPGYGPLLDEAAQLAKAVGIPQALSLIAVARAEAAWLEGTAAEHASATETESIPWFPGELTCWRWRAGLPVGDMTRLAEPYRLELTGDSIGAARWWEGKGCRYEAAVALASSRDADLLRRALSALRELGAGPAAAIVAKRLRALGEQWVPRGPRPSTVANPAGLTEREVQVLTLLAVGLSNPEIAARLVVSGRTVDHHVSAILRKLRVRGRAEAGAEATRLGLILAELPGAAAPPARRSALPESGARPSGCTESCAQDFPDTNKVRRHRR